jgi:hypothetical protein
VIAWIRHFPTPLPGRDRSELDTGGGAKLAPGLISKAPPGQSKGEGRILSHTLFARAKLASRLAVRLNHPKRSGRGREIIRILRCLSPGKPRSGKIIFKAFSLRNASVHHKTAFFD